MSPTTVSVNSVALIDIYILNSQSHLRTNHFATMSLKVWTAQIKKQVWIWDDTYSIGQISHLSRLLRDILPLPHPSARLHGYNFIFNNQTNSDLGADGYDNYQAPKVGGRALFSRRMWVGGSLHHILPLRVNDVVQCIERVTAVRQVGPSVFVTIGRDMKRTGQRVMTEKRTLVYTNERYEAPDTGREVLRSGSLGAGFGEKARISGCGNQDPGSNKPPASGEIVADDLVNAVPLVTGFSLKCNSDTHSAGLRFGLSDVMRFCSLSYNLHKIHYDRNYCLSENLAAVVVPGPLLALVMLHYVSSMLPQMEIAQFTYRNSLPCYIDEEVEIVLLRHDARYKVFVMRGLQLLAGGALALRPEGPE